MKNKIFYLTIFVLTNLLINLSYGNDQFIFDITEVEITENGNKFKGTKKGIVKTNNGLNLIADEFEYDKILNILNAKGNVKIIDTINKSIIFSDKIIYLKNQEIIHSKGNSKAEDNGLIIKADNFEYNKNLNIINANNNVEIIDTINEYLVFTENVTYFKNKEKLLAQGDTKVIIDNDFEFNSKEILFLRDKNFLSSSLKSYVTQNNSALYKFDKFEYQVDKDLLKGENVEIISENLLNNGFSDKAIFSEGFFKLKSKNYVAGESKFYLKKDTLGVTENDPRLLGVSSSRKNQVIKVNKGVFTSCSKNSTCPAWSIKADRIRHDMKKKQLIYDNAVLRLYDKPVFYFPKFFHPDPSVKRQSGILQPALNDDEVLGSSIYLPYFYVISDNKDLTIKPTIFEDSMFMLRNEYRVENKYSSFIADFNLVQNYKPTLSKTKKNISHFFSKFKTNLNLKNFNESILNFSLQRVSNDTYLRVFDSNLIDMALKPNGKTSLVSSATLDLQNENFSFDTGITVHENLLETKKNDRYQYVLPYYNFTKTPIELKSGFLNFYSSGDNRLINTNNLKSKIVNDISYENYDIYTKNGFRNNLNAYLKNINRVSKKDAKYKSNTQIELATIFEGMTSFPMMKINGNTTDYLIPKISFRFNPSDMSDNSSSNNNIGIDNIFNINRLGVSDTYEGGKSLTIGIDYKKESIQDINKYFQLKLGTVFRDVEEDRISSSSTINRKGSNLFGSIDSNFTDFFKLEYDFAIDNDLNSFEHNNIKSTFLLKNITTEFNFTETNGEMGDTNILSNYTSISLNEKNSLTFGTRRNRKISLTEYYDLIYSYKNDCLSAGIKYKKTYYKDRELRPKEDLLLSITIFPITKYEHEIDQSIYRGPNSINDLFDDL